MQSFARIGRHLTIILFTSQSLGLAGFITAGKINSIVAKALSGDPF